jgi:hypothetical protein
VSGDPGEKNVLDQQSIHYMGEAFWEYEPFLPNEFVLPPLG